MPDTIIMILRYVILYGIIVAGSIGLTHLFKKKTNQTIPLSILLIMVILYLFGLIKELKLGIICIGLIYGILAIYSIIRSFIKHTHKELIKNVFTKGFIVFTIIFVVFAITTFHKTFTVWDEYTYWSVASKNMYYLNDFPTNSSSTVNLIYPPNPTLLQYFFTKIIGVYSQGIELFAVQILGFSLLLPIFEFTKKKRTIALLSCICILFCIPAIFVESYFYITIYVDTLMGLIIGYTLLSYFQSNKDMFAKINVLISLFVLTLIKPTGVFLAIITLGVMGLEYLIRTLKEKKKIKNIIFSKEILFFIILMIGIVLAFSSWKLFERKEMQGREKFNDFSNTQRYEGNPITYLFNSFFNSFLGYEKNGQDTISNMNLYYDVFDKPYYSTKPFEMSAGTWIIIFGLGSIGIYKFIIEKEKRKDFARQVLCIFVGLAVYILVLQVAYITAFAANEGVGHSSLQRYLGTYLVVILYYLSITGIQSLNKNEIYERCKYLILTGIILVFTPIAPIANSTVVAGAYNNMKEESLNFNVQEANRVKSLMEGNERIYPVHQTSNKDTHLLRFRYFMTPIYIPLTDRFCETRNTVYIGASSLEEWKKMLYEGYDLVYVLQSDEYFNDNNGEIFENHEVKNWTVYEIQKNDTNHEVLLIPIE